MSLLELECKEFRKTGAANEASRSYYGSWGNKEVGVNSLMCMFAAVGGTQVTLNRAKAKAKTDAT